LVIPSFKKEDMMTVRLVKLWYHEKENTHFKLLCVLRLNLILKLFQTIRNFCRLWNESRAVSAALHTPQLGGHAVTGAQNSVPSPLSPKRKLRAPKLKYEALEIREVWGSCERKVLMHCSYFRPLWKQGIYTLQLLLGDPSESKAANLYITVSLGPLWKQGTLGITVAIGGPFESVVSLLTHYIAITGLFESVGLPHYNCYGGPFESRAFTQSSCCWGPLWRQRTELRVRCGSENIQWADNKFFTKMRNIYAGNTLRGARGKCLACLPLNTPLYITLTMILYDNMKPIEHVLLHPICVLSHLTSACKNSNVKLSLYYWTHWSCWWIYHYKKHRFNAIFQN